MQNKDYIKQNWDLIRNDVEQTALKCGRNPGEIRIVAVAKTHPAEFVVAGVLAGIKVIGENYVQELTEKHAQISAMPVPQPEWHFIGHLQTNKVKYIAPFITMIHSVDSLHLAEEISKAAQKNDRTIDVLLQVNTSGEESKFGCEPAKVPDLAESALQLPYIKVHGLMTIGTFTELEEQSIKEFRLLRNLCDEINRKLYVNLTQLSMGMTHDYRLAIAEGATYVRIGTAIFGER
ncbi:MAG: YggS family pyridoxal phosphate-dependent enzyme [Bacteroidota bacterium]|jgi:hypothetical protein